MDKNLCLHAAFIPVGVDVQLTKEVNPIVGRRDKCHREDGTCWGRGLSGRETGGCLEGELL